MQRRLPPLNAIRAFEASARLGGFVAAAGELGVSPAAVSLQVKKLEQHYGAALFLRLPSGVELTDLGRAVFADCQAAIATLMATNDLASGAGQRERVVLSCINSLAHRWLAQRLVGFAAENPDFSVELRAEADPVEFGSAGCDIRLTYGLHLYASASTHRAEPLFTDRLTPLCTPGFLAAQGIDPADPASLRDEHLIHVGWAPSFFAYPGWEAWFGAAGAPRQPRQGAAPLVNMPALAIDLALSGLGVALGQLSLATGPLASGRLVRPFAAELRMEDSYGTVVPLSARHDKRVTRMLRWLRAEAALLEAPRGG